MQPNRQGFLEILKPNEEGRDNPLSANWFDLFDVDGSVEMSQNGGPWVRVREGDGDEDPERQLGIQSLRFREVGGAAAQVYVRHGTGIPRVNNDSRVRNDQLTISNLDAAEFAFAAGDKAELNPPAVSWAPGFESISNEEKTYTGKKTLTVENTGMEPITVNGRTLYPGLERNFTAPGRRVLVGAVVVNTVGANKSSDIEWME